MRLHLETLLMKNIYILYAYKYTLSLLLNALNHKRKLTILMNAIMIFPIVESQKLR